MADGPSRQDSRRRISEYADEVHHAYHHTQDQRRPSGALVLLHWVSRSMKNLAASPKITASVAMYVFVQKRDSGGGTERRERAPSVMQWSNPRKFSESFL